MSDLEFKVLKDKIYCKKEEELTYNYISPQEIIDIIEDLKNQINIKDKKIRQLAELDELSKRRRSYDKNSDPDMLSW